MTGLPLLQPCRTTGLFFRTGLNHFLTHRDHLIGSRGSRLPLGYSPVPENSAASISASQRQRMRHKFKAIGIRYLALPAAPSSAPEASILLWLRLGRRGTVMLYTELARSIDSLMSGGIGPGRWVLATECQN